MKISGKFLIFILIIILIGVVWLFQRGDQSRLTVGPSPGVGQGGGPPKSMEVRMSPVEDSEIQQSSKATLEEMDGALRIRLEITTSAVLNSPQPAHFHAGECPGLGRIVYPLNDVVNGQSETILNLTLDQLKNQLPLAINVHKSADEINVYTSCGELTK